MTLREKIILALREFTRQGRTVEYTADQIIRIVQNHGDGPPGGTAGDGVPLRPPPPEMLGSTEVSEFVLTADNSEC